MGHRNKTQEKATLRGMILYTDWGSIEIGTEAWDLFIMGNDKFYISAMMNKRCEVSVRVEVRSGTRHWYAYKRVQGTLYKRYVGQKPSYGDLIKTMERMVGTDLFIPKQPAPRFDSFR